MTRDEFMTELVNVYDECVSISKRKNQDYAQDEDPFQNFRMSEFMGVSIPRGILVRVTDKLVRAANLLDKDPIVANESLDDTIKDALNYLAFILIYRRQGAEPRGVDMHQSVGFYKFLQDYTWKKCNKDNPGISFDEYLELALRGYFEERWGTGFPK